MKSKIIYILVGESGKLIRHNAYQYSMFATSLKAAKEMLFEAEHGGWEWGQGKKGSFDSPYCIKKNQGHGGGGEGE